MFSNCTNSKQKGNVGLGLAIAYFTKKGYILSLPLNDAQDYDIIIDDGQSLKKVQVKTTNCISKYGHYCVGLRILGGNSKQNYVHKKANQIVYDLLFVVCGNGDMYLIPKHEIQHITSQICLGKDYDIFRLDSEAVKHTNL